MGYSRTFGSKYPSECISLGKHKDVDNTVVSLINQYNTYVQAGNMTAAANFYAQNKTTLDSYALNISYINRLEEEIYNTGLYALSSGSSSSIISDAEPVADQNIGAYWLKDY